MIIILDRDALIEVRRNSVKLISFLRSHSVHFSLRRVTFWFWFTQHSVAYIFIILFVNGSGHKRWSLLRLLVRSGPRLLLYWLNCRVSYLRCSFDSIKIRYNALIFVIIFKNIFILRGFLHSFYTLLENVWFLFNSLCFVIVACAHWCILISHSLFVIKIN